MKELLKYEKASFKEDETYSRRVDGLNEDATASSEQEEVSTQEEAQEETETGLDLDL